MIWSGETILVKVCWTYSKADVYYGSQVQIDLVTNDMLHFTVTFTFT